MSQLIFNHELLALPCHFGSLCIFLHLVPVAFKNMLFPTKMRYPMQLHMQEQVLIYLWWLLEHWG